MPVRFLPALLKNRILSGADGWDAGYCYAHRLLDVLHGEIEKNSETAASALCAADIAANEALGKISALASVEEGGIFKRRYEPSLMRCMSAAFGS